jgi:hypothetical protein
MVPANPALAGDASPTAIYKTAVMNPPSTLEHPVGDTPAAASESQRPDDNHQRSGRRKRDWIEKINAWAPVFQIATVPVAVLAVIVSWLQANEASRQADEARRQADIAQEALVVADRPWVKVVGLSDVSIRVEEHVVTLFAKVNVTNTGRSPAQETFLKTKLLANADLDESTQAANALCRDFIEGKYISPTYQLIFPKEDRVLSDITGIDMKSIVSNRHKEIQELFESNKSMFGNKKAEEFRVQAEAVPPFAAFHMVGCINYKIPTGLAIGQTAFVYGVYRPCESPTGLCAFSMTETGVFEGDDLQIQEPITGTFAR